MYKVLGNYCHHIPDQLMSILLISIYYHQKTSMDHHYHLHMYLQKKNMIYIDKFKIFLPLPPPLTPAHICRVVLAIFPCIQSFDVGENTCTVTCRRYSNGVVLKKSDYIPSSNYNIRTN